jgi:hypothetical protein
MKKRGWLRHRHGHNGVISIVIILVHSFAHHPLPPGAIRCADLGAPYMGF